MDSFRLLMLSAMYENGGNTTHRFLDGHPKLRIYPFESQLGTRLVNDHLSSLYPAKYRWPVFGVDQSPEEMYESIIDEECRVRLKTPHVSKFRERPMAMEERHRKACFLRRFSTTNGASTTGRAMQAFFEATFEAWRDGPGVTTDGWYVGYSPIVAVDTARILATLPGARVLHVVRNPWSAYADTKKRPVPLSLDHYMTGWCVAQQHALNGKALDSERVRILRYEELIADPEAALRPVCAWLGIDWSPALTAPSWNGHALTEVYPWGTIRAPSPEANRKASEELSPDEFRRVESWASPLLDAFGYASPPQAA